MTDAISFDTHRFVKNLTASGFTEEQAEALAVEHVHLLNSNLATKAGLATVDKRLQVEMQALQVEIQTVNKKLQVEIQNVRKDLQIEMHKVKADLLKWMIMAMIAQAGVIVALVQLL